MFGIETLLDRINPQRRLGIGLRPGDRHYRAYIGPPEDYDLVAAMSFGLLTTLGLRQHHAVLDIGCGSLRIGRLLIPYLNAGNYTGIEPNRWLVAEGMRLETGGDQIRLKQAKFHYSDSASGLVPDASCDFSIAQSIFSHCGPDLVERWLKEAALALKDSGALVATFLPADEDSRAGGWVYPDCVNYTVGTMEKLACDAGMKFLMLDWKHPRQSWALFCKPGFDTSWFERKPLTWNTWLESAPKGETRQNP